MSRPRITIASLLGLIAGIGVAIAALRAANQLWDSALFGLVALALLTSVLLAMHRTGKQRAGWVGFALFG